MHRTTAPSAPVPSQATLLIAMGMLTLHGLRWPSLSQKFMTALLWYTIPPFKCHAASDGVPTTALAHGTRSVVSSPDMCANSHAGKGCGAPSFYPTSHHRAPHPCCRRKERNDELRQQQGWSRPCPEEHPLRPEVGQHVITQGHDRHRGRELS